MNTFLKRLHDPYFTAPAANRSVLDRQRQRTFVYACLALIISDVALWFLGMGAFGDPRYEISHPLHLLLMLSMLVWHFRGKLSLTVGVAVICLSNQLAIVFDVWVCNVVHAAGEPLRIGMIMGYMVMAGFNMLLVLMAYIPWLPFVVGGLALATYGACCWVNDERVFMGLLPIFTACFLVIMLLEYYLCDDIQRLEQEKGVLKTDEQKILNLLEMDKSQLTAYISIAKEKGLSAEQTETLLDMIGKKARDNIRDNVAYYYRQREIDYAGLGARLPWLTPSEIEICDLILREKKQKEMIRILGKSESNITSQRANIRRKLGLAPSDNLRDVLVRIASGD